MKPYTAADLGPTGKPLVMRGLDVPQLTRLLDLREEEIRELERALGHMRNAAGEVECCVCGHPLASHLNHTDRFFCSICGCNGTSMSEDLTAKLRQLRQADRALASHPAPEPVALQVENDVPTLDELVKWARQQPPPTEARKREQAISFAYGNLKLSGWQGTREDIEKAADELWKVPDPEPLPRVTVDPSVPPDTAILKQGEKEVGRIVNLKSAAPEPVKLPEGIYPPFSRIGHYSVINANGSEVLQANSSKEADWICDALNAARGGK